MPLCASQKLSMFFLSLLISVIWASAQQEGHDVLLHSAFILYVFCWWVTVV